MGGWQAGRWVGWAIGGQAGQSEIALLLHRPARSIMQGCAARISGLPADCCAAAARHV